MEMVAVKVTSAFMVGGEIARPGEIVEVTNSEAKDLLHRGMAVLATEEDEPAILEVDVEAEVEAEVKADAVETDAPSEDEAAEATAGKKGK